MTLSTDHCDIDTAIVVTLERTAVARFNGKCAWVAWMDGGVNFSITMFPVYHCDVDECDYIHWEADGALVGLAIVADDPQRFLIDIVDAGTEPPIENIRKAREALAAVLIGE